VNQRSVGDVMQLADDSTQHTLVDRCRPPVFSVTIFKDCCSFDPASFSEEDYRLVLAFGQREAQ